MFEVETIDGSDKTMTYDRFQLMCTSNGYPDTPITNAEYTTLVKNKFDTDEIYTIACDVANGYEFDELLCYNIAQRKLHSYADGGLNADWVNRVWFVTDNIIVFDEDDFNEYSILAYHFHEATYETQVEVVKTGTLAQCMTLLSKAESVNWMCGKGDMETEDLCIHNASHKMGHDIDTGD